MQSLRNKKKWIEDYETGQTLIDDLEVIYEFYKEGEATQKAVIGQTCSCVCI